MDRWAVGVDGLPGAWWRACLAAAAAAPSVHNTQPWRFRVAGPYVDVLTDTSRRLDVLDPTGRELMISVGAAVFNLRVAILVRRRRPMVWLTPDPDRPRIAARVGLGPPIEPPASAFLLARAIPRRHSNRGPFLDVPVPDAALTDLKAAARVEGCGLTVAGDPARGAIIRLVNAAERQWRCDTAYWRELDAWTGAAEGRCDGVPPEAFGPLDVAEAAPIRDFGLTAAGRRRPSARYEAEPVLAVLHTAGDTTYEWIGAGLALERVLLTATVHGLATTLMTQPLELPHLRRRMSWPIRDRFPQAILRVGYGPPTAPTPRRPVDALIEPLLVH